MDESEQTEGERDEGSSEWSGDLPFFTGDDKREEEVSMIHTLQKQQEKNVK